MDIKELLTILEDFDPKDTRKPEESDLDDIYDAIQTLNKAEWFTNVKEESEVLHRAQNILQGILDTAEGDYEDDEEDEDLDEALKESAERYLSVEPEGLVLYCGDKVEDRLDKYPYVDGMTDQDVREAAKKCFKNITDDIRVQWY